MSGSIRVGAVINRIFTIYRDQWAVLIPAASVVFILSGLLTQVLITASPALALLAIPITVVATALFTGMIVELVAEVQAGRNGDSVGGLVRAVLPVLWPLAGVGLVAGIVEVIGFILIIIPGLILVTIWAVFAPVIVLERPRGLAALNRSSELVRGNGWEVFGVILSVFVLVFALDVLLSLAAASAGAAAGLVVRVVMGVLTAPLSALAAAVLYFDLRAASVSGNGPHDPGQGGTPPVV
ncbi:MAG: hypothetical protein ACYDA6_01960 [Solirubrobacteraceae bacterium]